MLDSFKRVTNSVVGIVNHTPSSQKRLFDVLVSKEDRQNFLTCVRHVANKPFILGSMAEISERISDSRFIILKPGISFLEAREEDVQLFGVQNEVEFEEPIKSGHTEIHKKIYDQTSYGAVFISHPLNIYNHFKLSKNLDFSLFPELESLVPGLTQASIQSLPNILNDFRVVLIPGIGVVSVNQSLLLAIHQIEILEWVLQTTRD